MDTSWPCENNAPLLAATGMYSTVNDMLRWCIAVLESEKLEKESESAGVEKGDQSSNSNFEEALQQRNNPLRQMRRIRRGYWTRPADDPEFSKPGQYGMGWVLKELPASTLSAQSGNIHSRKKPHQTHLDNILGRDSEPFQCISHTGGGTGSISSVFTFPNTQSAVVTMTNGRILGDASDFAAQILIQALFNLTPAVDVKPWARTEADLVEKHLREEVLETWEKGRRLKDPKRDPEVYIGHYRGFRGHFSFEVSTEMGAKVEQAAEDSTSKLFVTFNGRQSSKTELVFYREDVYCFDQPKKDEVRRMQGPDDSASLLEFQFDESTGRITGLFWRWDSDEERAWLGRVME